MNREDAIFDKAIYTKLLWGWLTKYTGDTQEVDTHTRRMGGGIVIVCYFWST